MCGTPATTYFQEGSLAQDPPSGAPDRGVAYTGDSLGGCSRVDLRRDQKYTEKYNLA